MPIPRIPVKKRSSSELFSRVLLILGIILVAVFTMLFLGARLVMYQIAAAPDAGGWSMKAPTTTPALPPFPLGVNPAEELIVENPAVEEYFHTHIPQKSFLARMKGNMLGSVLAALAEQGWYQNLASPTGRVLVILSGERREEVAGHFGKVLGWSAEEKQRFLIEVASTSPELDEGKYLPANYIAHKGATPEEAARLVTDRFEMEVSSRYSDDINAVVPIEDALIIASLLEREAYDFTDMRYISGIIWNRLFVGMKLQIDATLQYAKGTKSQSQWWPRVVPADKNIASPYNTYKNAGLPPAPIANPSLDAILAALNPRETDCMFYFHDRDSVFHCTKTYEEHVALLKQYYGRGK